MPVYDCRVSTTTGNHPKTCASTEFPSVGNSHYQETFVGRVSARPWQIDKVKYRQPFICAIVPRFLGPHPPIEPCRFLSGYPCNFILRTPRASLMIRPQNKPISQPFFSRSMSSPVYFSGASGRRSITYLPFATLMIGTPGTFLILLFKSLSFVATRYTLCLTTRSTMQSSA